MLSGQTAKCKPYTPAFTFFPSSLTSCSKLMVVFSLAPARQGLLFLPVVKLSELKPYLTSSPQILPSLPPTSGREYLIAISVIPTSSIILALGLPPDGGTSICAVIISDNEIKMTVRNRSEERRVGK